MTAYLAPQFDTQFFDGSNVAAGYKLYTYDSGTSTPKTTYTDQAATTPNTNPITLDAQGMCELWLGSGEYTLALYTGLIESGGALVKSWDDVGGSASPGDIATINSQISALTTTVAAVSTVANAATQSISDLEDDTDPAKGLALGGFGPTLTYPIGSPASEIKAGLVRRRGRSAPNANFNFVATRLFTVTRCDGVGEASIDRDIADSFQAQFGPTLGGATVWVAPTGSDANGGSNLGDAWLTIGKALGAVGFSYIIVMPGVYDLANFQYTDASSTLAKWIYAPYGGVTLRTPGDSVSAAAWAPNGTYANVYETTLVTANYVTRLLRTDVLDKYGEPVPLPKYSSLVDVNNSSFGWWYDSATKKLYVRFGVVNVNTSLKANLRAVYGPGGDAKMFFNSVNVLLDNLTIEGYVWAFKAAGQAAPNVYLRNCTLKYSVTHALLNEGGVMVHQGCRAHRPSGDGANYNTSAGATGLGLEINFRSEFAGDITTYGTSQTTSPQGTGPNKNGSSNHDGYVVRINGEHYDMFGPGIADTAGSYSWNLGTFVGYSDLQPFTSPGTPRYGFLSQGNHSWMDGCESTGNDYGFNSDSSADVQTFNCSGTQVITNSGTFTPYVPA